MKGGRGESVRAGRGSGLWGKPDAGCTGCGEDRLSASGYWWLAWVKGEGSPGPDCKPAWAGGYWPGRAPEMTSEMDGSDWRPVDSLSSDDRRGSVVIMLLELAAAGGGCWG